MGIISMLAAWLEWKQTLKLVPLGKRVSYFFLSSVQMMVYFQRNIANVAFCCVDCRVTTRTLHPLCSKAVKNVALVSIKLAQFLLSRLDSGSRLDSLGPFRRLQA